jgi:hypothetical protein
MTTQRCKMCGRSFGTLTEAGLCAYCHKAKYGTWAKEFTNEEKMK